MITYSSLIAYLEMSFTRTSSTAKSQTSWFVKEVKLPVVISLYCRYYTTSSPTRTLLITGSTVRYLHLSETNCRAHLTMRTDSKQVNIPRVTSILFKSYVHIAWMSWNPYATVLATHTCGRFNFLRSARAT